MNKTDLRIGLSNPKSPDNVGSVQRAAGNYRVESIVYTGQRYPRALENNPDTPNTGRKVSENVPISGVESLTDNLPDGMQVICVEFAENATSLPVFEHPDNAIYIFGPEDGTLSQKIIDSADEVVYVPTIGCMNLAATVNVVLYDRLAKSVQNEGSNELIRQNRDRNNNLIVKS